MHADDISASQYKMFTNDMEAGKWCFHKVWAWVELPFKS